MRYTKHFIERTYGDEPIRRVNERNKRQVAHLIKQVLVCPLPEFHRFLVGLESRAPRVLSAPNDTKRRRHPADNPSISMSNNRRIINTKNKSSRIQV